ncbi:MAG: M1 family aminopeptidase [Acidobacteria bacterium]|nr:M1 family aminopeptidase [Acidobacteriota bacterium]
MSEWFNRSCPWAPAFLAVLLAGSAPLPAQQIDPGPSIDVEEYDVSVELRPSQQELQAAATLKFSSSQDRLTRIFLDFNGNLTVKRIYFADQAPAPGSLSRASGQRQVASGPDREEEGVPFLSRRRRPAPKPSSKPGVPAPETAAADPTGQDPNLLAFQQDFNQHLLEVQFPRWLDSGQTASLVIEYDGRLFSAEHSPLYGVTTARVSDELCYLLDVSRWFPTHGYRQDRARATFRVTVPWGYLVAMDGEVVSRERQEEKETFTIVNRQQDFPGSLAAAPFNEIPVRAGQVELRYYVMDHKRDFLDAHTRVIGELLDLYSDKFAPYPSRTFRVAVIDNDSLLGFSSPGLQFLAGRAFGPQPNVNLLAKEIAYQWWGSLITPRTERDLWLKEGFSAYSALLYQESVSSRAEFAEQLKEVAVAALLYEGESSILNANLLDLYSPEYNSVLKNKGAYVLHMLRSVIGDEKWFELMKQFVYDYGYKTASIGDFKALAEKISEKDLGYFFSQWIEQTGVPEFQYEFTTYRIKDGFRVDGVIRQDLDLFRMPMEILIETEGEPETKQIEVMGMESFFSVPTFGKPIKAVIDPNHRLLRVSDDIRLATLIAKGDELRRIGEYTAAITQYQEAIELKKRSSLAFFRIGEVFLEQRSTQSAANSFREALNGDLDPQWIEVWCYVNLGKIFDMAGQRDRALNEYQKALDTNDDTQGAQQIAQKHIEEPYRYQGPRVLIR